MKKFEIEFTGRMKIKAKDFDQVRKKFADRYPEHMPTEIIDLETRHGKEVVGRCEITDLPVYDDDDYISDEEGSVVLKKYYDELVQESERINRENREGNS